LKDGDTVYVRATRVPIIPGEALTLNDTGSAAPTDDTSVSAR
jgi:hypothetical protein